VVFDEDGQSLFDRIERGPFGDGPALEDPIELEAQVPMQT